MGSVAKGDHKASLKAGLYSVPASGAREECSLHVLSFQFLKRLDVQSFTSLE